MHILVFGHSGQVAQELRALSSEDVVITTLDRSAADLCDAPVCAEAILTHTPDAVINAAAYTAVDRAEQDEQTAHLVNATAPAAMARICAGLGIPFVTLSTDYVFDGGGTRPWMPDDPTNPVSAYGRTKRAGEVGVQAAGGAWIVLRTSWVVSSHGANFVKTMLRLGAERDALAVVDDQIGGPTAAADVARACITIAQTLKSDPSVSGIYHFAGAPDASWADFARSIFEKSGLACAVTGIASVDYPTPAQRPLNSRMDCTATARVFGIARPDWRSSLDDILMQLDARQPG
jgi:dTDP-4-dehydrorhamnose reductase